MRKLASIREVSEILPIEGADRIELAKIDGWQCVVKKGEFQTGDRCVYFEIDSVLPDAPWSEFLGSKKRVRTMKMRGQLSQGLALPLEACGVISDDLIGCMERDGADLADLLGVTKWEPPQHGIRLGGETQAPFPTHLLPRTDEERVQNCKKELAELQGKPYTITLKLDGTSFTAIKKDGELIVCSRNQTLKEGDNAYWRIAKELRLEELLPEGVAIQGELCGPGIQGNKLGLEKPELFAFNVVNIDNGHRFDYHHMTAFLSFHALDIKPVPLVEEGESFGHSQADLLAFAEGKYEGTKNEREGIVIRHCNGFSRISFKAISNRYLLKNNE